MYETPGNYLITYDPGFTEEHSDSSDFEESCIPLISKKEGNHSLLNKKTRKTKNMYIQEHFTYEYPVKLPKEQETKAVQVDKKFRKKHMNFNRGDQPQTDRSKLSLRQKIVPSLSSLFRRPAKYNNMSTINENSENDSLQHCGNCERRRTKKLYKKQNYAVQPVYAIEADVHKPVPFTQKMADPLHAHKKSKNQYSTCSITSSESETQMKRIKLRSLKMRKRFKEEVMKEHWKYQRQELKNQKLQYPSKDHKSPYQVFTSPYQQSRTNVKPSDDQYSSEMPASSSGFWEYLFDKINRKYQVQKMEMPKPCHCSSSDQVPCHPSNCENFETKAENESCKGHQQSSVGNNCSCTTKPASKCCQKSGPSDYLPPFFPPTFQEPASGCCQKSGPSETLPPFFPPTLPSNASKNSLSLKIKPAVAEKKAQCKCSDKYDANSKGPSKFSRPQQSGTVKAQSISPKPCQEAHDDITAALATKYNGEILCIHNPPCILINGCLNLPQKNDPPQTNLWPVSESKKSAFKNKKKAKTLNCEQGCQYLDPYVEVRQCFAPEYKVEKKIQSICHHNPPCEVVRGCYKPKYDPKLQNSCVHVPMCQKFPRCVIEQNGRSCEHRPRCPELPVCSRNYKVFNAKENFGVQVKPKPLLICRHVPPCILIPRCLGRAMCDYIPCEALPGCVHQPACDPIPACCRKCTKDMVSVSSQYPNSCRIV